MFGNNVTVWKQPIGFVVHDVTMPFGFEPVLLQGRDRLVVRSKLAALRFEAPDDWAVAIPVVASRLGTLKPRLSLPHLVRVPALATPALHRDLAPALSQPMTRQIVMARQLSPDVAAYWLDRLVNAKRLNRRHTALIGVVPDVPLLDEAPARLVAGGSAIAFAPSDRPVKLSTVVLARRTDADETIAGRFHRL